MLFFPVFANQDPNLSTFSAPAALRPQFRDRYEKSVAATPLAATLVNLPASVANKELAGSLSPLNSTLTKNRGWEGMVNQATTGRSIGGGW